jgi:hypothetical protein
VTNSTPQIVNLKALSAVFREYLARTLEFDVEQRPNVMQTLQVRIHV